MKKTKIKEQVQEVLKDYNKIKSSLMEKIKELQTSTMYSEEYKAEKIKEIHQEAEQHDVRFNSRIKEIVELEKKAIIGVADTKADDYQVQISNALKFIEMAGDKLSDDQAYSILKPFQADYETMKLFQSVIGNKVTGDMFHTFGKTFGKTNSFITLINSFELAESTAGSLLAFKDNGLSGGVKTTMFLDSIDTIEKLAEEFAA